MGLPCRSCIGRCRTFSICRRVLGSSIVKSRHGLISTTWSEAKQPAAEIAVFFGGDVAIPLELTEADVSLQEFTRRHDDAYAEHPEWLSADDAPPTTFTNPQMAIRHRRPVRVCGSCCTPTTLDASMIW